MSYTPSKIEVSPEKIRAIATRRAFGISLRDLEAEFGFSRPVINRVLSSEIAKAIQKEIIETAVNGAVTAIKRELAEMSDLALTALRENLKEHSMEAVKTYFKALGIEAQEKESGQQQALQIIMPGATAPRDIEVEK